jgi:uncharacterized membrane protein YccC
MTGGKDYLREVQKFTTGQHWNSGLRITAGVMVPLLFLVHTGYLSQGIPFLWGALFVSLTDTPGPIHHRRNGMVAAILLNAVVVMSTGLTRDYQVLLVTQIMVAGFLLSMTGIYGSRAGAVGSLALVIMLLSLLTAREEQHTLRDSALIAAGGTWYMILSLLLYRLRPYRLVEQGLGENLIAIADYVRARASFYKENADLPECYNRVMDEQREVKKIQDQIQELLFKTRKFVADASPKSRSMMMIYLDSLDLFEQTMYAYQDYGLLRKALGETKLLTGFYGLILQLAAGLEYIGISVQRGIAVKKDLDLNVRIDTLEQLIRQHQKQASQAEVINGLQALDKTLANIRNIANRMNKLVLYTRLEVDSGEVAADVAQQVSNAAVSQPFSIQLLRENLTFQSNTFRHALRLTMAMLVAYGVAVFFSLSHTYWVLLTIVTIMKPVYSVTRKRNIQRLSGTFTGVVLVSVILYFIPNNTVLLLIMVMSMLMGYSLLRVNYFAFVVFLTIFVIITFHFLDPLEFKTLIRERLVDTVIGSVIAAVAARFVFPAWGSNEIRPSMVKMLAANRGYFIKAWEALKMNDTETVAYESARKDAVVALTNLSEVFQHTLAEPQQTSEATAFHQFVIANHLLTSHIAALSTDKNVRVQADHADLEAVQQATVWQLEQAEDHLQNASVGIAASQEPEARLPNQTLNQLSMIYTLARDVRRICSKFKV